MDHLKEIRYELRPDCPRCKKETINRLDDAGFKRVERGESKLLCHHCDFQWMPTAVIVALQTGARICDLSELFTFGARPVDSKHRAWEFPDGSCVRVHHVDNGGYTVEPDLSEFDRSTLPPYAA